MSIGKSSPGRLAITVAALVVLLTICTLAASAQEPAPRSEIFVGYSWTNVGGKAAIGPPLAGFPYTAASPTQQLRDIPLGFGGAFNYNFNKYFSLAVDAAGHWGKNAHSDSQTVAAGPQLHLRGTHFSPFLEVLAGMARLAPPGLNGSKDTGFGGLAGGGIDLYLNRKIAWRVVQADYVYQSHSVSSLGGNGSFNGARIQTGLVFGLGSLGKPVMPTASCAIEPGTPVMAGSPVTATAAAKGFNMKHTVAYQWKTTGGQLTAKDASASIDTAGLAPGNYTVTATATDAKAQKNYQAANCSGTFTIQEPPKHPPVISCSPNPATVRSGDPSRITCSCTSPDNRPVNYAAKTSAGRLTGTGPAYTLDTAGVPQGTVRINATCTDDRGLSASTSTQVGVTVPPPAPQASKIAEILFPNLKKPWRVDNTAKAILDDVALRLQREPSARAMAVGYFEPDEKGGVSLAQERAVNTKAYLTDEKGIDPGRIGVATGTAGGKRAEVYLIPAGGVFSVPVQSFDESKVKKAAPEGRHAPAKHPAKKKAAAPKQ
jgi:outer membrane protein OmpA-like peptidoglycan-associated protein